METEELDMALEELEIRLERLRSLYEQYFLGIEKLEPTVARKDVDRRIFVLRREKIRNTGKRFKLQTVIQRYNTFQQYWGRICREIENGTYRRHVLRAERTMGPTALLTVAARRRFGKERESQAPAAERAPSNGPASDDASGSVHAGLESALPVPPARLETPTAPRATLAELQAPGVPKGGPFPLRRRRDTPPMPFPMPPSQGAPGPPVPDAPGAPDSNSVARARSTRPPDRPARQLESLELDMDFLGDWDPSQSRAASGAASRATSAKASSPRAPQRAAVTDTEPQAGLAAPHVPPKPSPPPKPARLVSPANAPTPIPGSATPAAVADSAARAQRPVAPEADPVSAPNAPVLAGKTASTTSPVANAAARAAARASALSAGAAPPKPAAPTSTLSEARLRELHARISEASREANLPGVSLDGLSRSLRAAEAKLRAQHGNRRIEFEVLVKEGKPVVKPVVR